MIAARLLIVDDDPDLGELLRRVCQAKGWEANLAGGHPQCFRQLSEWQPTLVFLDLCMSLTDGTDILSALANRGCQVPVILMSGLGADVLEKRSADGRARGLNIIGFIAKPFSMTKFRETLSAASVSTAA